MQINRLGWFLLAFFGLGGLAIVVVPFFIPGGEAAYFVTLPLGGIWALVAFGLLLYALRSARQARHQQWVFQTGLRGVARILQASSGAAINEMPVMSLVVELEFPGMGTRRTTRREIMSVFAARRMQPGTVLPAYVNPDDPEDFILVW
jgi:hypothetical protein